MFRNALRLGSVRGIDISVDASWLIIAALITWSFWGQFSMIYEQPGGTALAMAVVAAVLFFASVLAHELAHALEALSRGVHVGGITLFLFGGVTESKFDVRRPVDELALTIVGPLTSFGLAGVFAVVAQLAEGADPSPAAQVAGNLAWINLALGVFNLIPGAPLDGGRILRAGIWKATGDRQRSIRVAADVGRVVGGLLVVLGILQLLLVDGALFGGLWLALVGWFLVRGAAAEKAQAQMAELLGEVPAGAVVRRTAAASRDDTLASVLDRWITDDGDPDVLPVVDGGRLVGVVGVDDARSIAEPERASAPVASVMTPVEDLPTVDVDRPASEAMAALGDRGYVVATDHGRPVGLIDGGRLVAVAQRRARVHAGP